jgi:hypothetical protein
VTVSLLTVDKELLFCQTQLPSLPFKQNILSLLMKKLQSNSSSLFAVERAVHFFIQIT